MLLQVPTILFLLSRDSRAQSLTLADEDERRTSNAERRTPNWKKRVYLSQPLNLTSPTFGLSEDNGLDMLGRASACDG